MIKKIVLLALVGSVLGLTGCGTVTPHINKTYVGKVDAVYDKDEVGTFRFWYWRIGVQNAPSEQDLLSMYDKGLVPVKVLVRHGTRHLGYQIYWLVHDSNRLKVEKGDWVQVFTNRWLYPDRRWPEDQARIVSIVCKRDDDACYEERVRDHRNAPECGFTTC